VGALLMGRVAYEGMSQAWPAMGNDPSTGGDIMNSIGKYVPTSTLTEPTWNATFLTGDVVDEVTRLEAGDENLVIYGSGKLTETLRSAGLIDEYRLIVCPSVLGDGRRLFTGGTPSEFTVTDNRTAPSGMVLLTLAKA
jgi:dihydrofolate reductase